MARARVGSPPAAGSPRHSDEARPPQTAAPGTWASGGCRGPWDRTEGPPATNPPPSYALAWPQDALAALQRAYSAERVRRPLPAPPPSPLTVRPLSADCPLPRQGLLDVLPPYFLALMTWRDLELRVCGIPEIDIAELKKTAIYEDVHETDQICIYFWDVLSAFTQRELKLLLRFIAGRSCDPTPQCAEDNPPPPPPPRFPPP